MKPVKPVQPAVFHSNSWSRICFLHWNTGESADRAVLIGFLLMHRGHVHYF